MASAQLHDAVAVLRALRRQPAASIKEIAAETEIVGRKVYRLIDYLLELGAPIEIAGSQPAVYSLTAAGLKRWIG